MADPRVLAGLSDSALEDALRDLGRSLAAPVPAAADGLDPARAARVRIEAATAARATRPLFGRPLPRRAAWPLRRSFLIAAAALLVLAAIAGAIGLGLPRLRIITAPTPSPSPSSPSTQNAPSASASPAMANSPTLSPSPGPPGSDLGLGQQVTLEQAR